MFNPAEHLASPARHFAPVPPRIALVASSLKRAGAEKQTVYIARALHEAGMEVRFYHLGPEGAYKSVLCQNGIPVRQIYRPHRPFYILARLVLALREFRPHIVLVPQFGDLLQGGTAGRLSKALTLGGLRSDGFYELNAHGWMSPWMLKLAHGLIANSCRGKENLVSRGAGPERIRVLLNVLDLQEFDTRSRLRGGVSLPAGRCIAAAVGSLQPCKRFDLFLQALALARRQAPALFGVIAGRDHGCQPALEQEARALGLTPDHLLFAGECENIPALLSQADLLVLCSEYEGFPNVLLEAMAARLPIISTRAGDAEKVVIHGQTGCLVNGDRALAIASHLETLALSPATRAQFGAEGRRRVKELYDYPSLPARLFSVLRGFAVQHRRLGLAQSLPDWAAAARNAARPSAADFPAAIAV